MNMLVPLSAPKFLRPSTALLAIGRGKLKKGSPRRLQFYGVLAAGDVAVGGIGVIRDVVDPLRIPAPAIGTHGHGPGPIPVVGRLLGLFLAGLRRTGGR